MTDARFSWTQPACGRCFALRNPGREPMTLRETEPETCVWCGRTTHSGIYVRIDPAVAPHPTLTKEEGA